MVRRRFFSGSLDIRTVSVFFVCCLFIPKANFVRKTAEDLNNKSFGEPGQRDYSSTRPGRHWFFAECLAEESLG